MLAFLKLTGLGRRLGRVRRRMLAAAYEVLLYRHRPRAVIAAEGRLLASTAKYLLWLAPSLALGGAGFAAMYQTCSDRYGRGPARVGEPLVVRSRPADGSRRDLAECRLFSDDADLPLTAAAQVASLRTVWARFTPKRPGIFALRTGPGSAGRVLVNVESPKAPALRWQYVDGLEVHVQYPLRKWWGLDRGWMVFFLVACAVAAVPLGRWLRVPF
jgi:hypothetical protein